MSSPLSVSEVEALAAQHWSPPGAQPYDPSLVSRLLPCLTGDTLRALADSGYLESYLLPNLKWHTPPSHLLSCAILITEHDLNSSGGWRAEHGLELLFTMTAATVIHASSTPHHVDVTPLLALLRVGFDSLEVAPIRAALWPTSTLHMWTALSPSSRQLELARSGALTKAWSRVVADVGSSRDALQRLDAACGSSWEQLMQALSEEREVKSISTWTAVCLFPSILAAVASQLKSGSVHYSNCAATLTLLMQALGAHGSRRYLAVLLEDCALLPRLRLASEGAVGTHPLAATVVALCDATTALLKFPVHPVTGDALTPADLTSHHAVRVGSIQRLIHSHMALDADMKAIALAAPGQVQSMLTSHTAALERRHLLALCQHLRVLPLTSTGGGGSDWFERTHTPVSELTRDDCLKALIQYAAPHPVAGHDLNRMSVYPTEGDLWDATLPRGDIVTRVPPPIPRLGTQYLNLADYLLRNFTLYRLEMTYTVRADIVDAVPRLQASNSSSGVRFKGWARMAIPLQAFRVSTIVPPRVGQLVPASVTARFTVDMAGVRHRDEWDAIAPGETLYLMTITPPSASSVARPTPGMPPVEDPTFAAVHGVTRVRGASVINIYDATGVSLRDGSHMERGKDSDAAVSAPSFASTVINQPYLRTFVVSLDTAQYDKDTRAGVSELYTGLNVVLRRRGEASAGPRVLHTLRLLAGIALNSSDPLVPAWINDMLCGYGDPSTLAHTHAHSRAYGVDDDMRIVKTDANIDFHRTFVSFLHVCTTYTALGSFSHIRVCDDAGATLHEHDLAMTYATDVMDTLNARFKPPFRLTFPDETGAAARVLTLVPYVELVTHSDTAIAVNDTSFTPTQVRFIHSGLCEGLTLCVGPPGTGKTDTVAHLIATLYATHPSQRILIMTHSNVALDDIFTRVCARVPAHVCVRVGGGETSKLADTGEDFSNLGRVTHVLALRTSALMRVATLAASMHIQAGDVAYTCETAAAFYTHTIAARIEAYRAHLGVPPRPQTHTHMRAYKDACAVALARVPPGDVAATFPFSAYFESDVTAFTRTDANVDLALAETLIARVCALFDALAALRPMEVLRSTRARVEYMLCTHARVIAMTCTHAAMNWSRLRDAGFEFDTLICEEAAQMCDMDTFVPLTLQRHAVVTDSDTHTRLTRSHSRMRRVIMCGDHHQLPPVVTHAAIRAHAHMDASMFARFIRLGVPFIQLDMQGRARPSICALYDWRYTGLQSMPHTYDSRVPLTRVDPETGLVSHVFSRSYVAANAGMRRVCACIDVDGRESAPQPHFYQNVAEAEFLVYTYMYLRMVGYARERIVMLSTYNGQVALLRDIVRAKCEPHAWLGAPLAIETVDRFQGRDADIVLLSLVRTRTVGHIRDVRRFIVAVSRARLGLYVFARVGMFTRVRSLERSFQYLSAHARGGALPLELLPQEREPVERNAEDPVDESAVVRVTDADGMARVCSQLAASHMYASMAAAAHLAAAAAAPAPATESAAMGAGTGSLLTGDGDAPRVDAHEIASDAEE